MGHKSSDTVQKALAIYQTTHKKVASLIQWFDKVINDTILKDLDKANTSVWGVVWWIGLYVAGFRSHASRNTSGRSVWS